MCGDGNFHCQNEFRQLYIFSPHKRRSEIEKTGQYTFEKKKCEHGVGGQFDYKMIDNFAETAKQEVRESDGEFKQVEAQPSLLHKCDVTECNGVPYYQLGGRTVCEYRKQNKLAV